MKKPSLYVLFAVSSIDVLGFGVLIPLVPYMATRFGASPQLVPKIGVRPLLLAGCLVSAGGLYWQSQIAEHSS